MTIDVRSPRVRALLDRLIRAALDAADPARTIRRTIRVQGRILHAGPVRYTLKPPGRLVVLGAGKASARMAVAFEQAVRPLVPSGLIVVKHGHGAATRSIRVVEAGHPVPDRAGERAAARTLQLARSLTSQDLLAVLLSGGASSLWPAPARGLTLADKQRTTDLLLRCGAQIQEINAVRKHLSDIKGGRLAGATRARVLALILSDVLGDDLAAIGSGPTAPDPTTYRDACDVLQRYGIWRRVPAAVRTVLMEGRRGQRPESPKPGEPSFRRVQHAIIGNTPQAVEAAAWAADRAGWRPVVLTTRLTGEARQAAHFFAAVAREIRSTGRPARPPVCLIAGGETTVTVTGNGLGGRAQEFALAAATDIVGLRDVWIAALGTDGTDGPTDAAGAVVDGATIARAARRGLDAHDALLRHDSYPFFARAGGHITIGPTGTNVNDLYLALIR